MLLPFLLCVLVLYVPLPLSGPVPPWPLTAAGVAALVLLHALACWLGSGLAVHLAGLPGSLPDVAASRVFSFLKGLMAGLVGAAVFGLEWPLLVERLLGRWRWAVLVDDLLLLLPAVVMALTLMAFQRRLEARRRQISLSPARYLWLRFRVELGIILAPWIALVLLTDISGALYRGTGYAPLAETGATAGVLLALVVGSPLLLRAVWKTSSLPAGPLRSRLEDFCRRNSFRCRDILLWHTEHHLANAGVIGPLPWLRYVLLSDALVSRCTEDEVEAVFAHEVGHIRHHHLPFYLILAVGFLCFYANLVDVLAAAGWVQPLGNIFGLQMTLPQAVAMLIFAAFYWILLFGFVSRRMEQQADVYSLRSAKDPEAFLGALDKLGSLARTSRRTSFWRHFGFNQRIEFLRGLLEDPRRLRKFSLKVTAIKVVLVALIAAGAIRLLLQRPELFGL